jgi:hypothetical protein
MYRKAISSILSVSARSKGGLPTTPYPLYSLIDQFIGKSIPIDDLIQLAQKMTLLNDLIIEIVPIEVAFASFSMSLFFHRYLLDYQLRYLY